MKILYYLLFLTIIISSGQAQVAVIANKSVESDKISKTKLLDFYTGEVKNWDNGDKVFVFDLKSKGELKETFYKYLGKSPSRMKSIWMKRMLSGDGDPPPASESEDEMLKKVEKTKGAIGFINYESVNNAVKVLTIIEIKKQ